MVTKLNLTTALYPKKSIFFSFLLYLLWSLVAVPSAKCQTISCFEMDCDAGQLFVQVVPDADYINTSSCQSSTPCGNGDLFRQLYYKVRLVYIPGTGQPSNFELDYRELRVDVQTQVPYANLPMCIEMILGSTITENNQGVSNVTITLQPDALSCTPNVCVNGVMQTGSSGEFGFCPCEECQYFSVIPFKNDNHVNGVTTFDLVLISQHILGLVPLDTPYKMIAADADKSNSITTFDIVELRQLILGQITEFSNNTSWRFIDKSFDFTNPNNPFPDAPFPEKVTQLQSSGSNTANFVAVKVGDVNGSATASRPETPAIAPIAWPLLQGRGKQQTISIPVIYTGQDSLLAFQIALQFDPQVLQLISPSAGDLPEFTQANYNITEADQGRLRLLWFPTNLYDETQRITPGATLFYLHFKTLAPIPEGDQLLQIDNNPIPGMAWAADGQGFSLEYTPAPAERFKRLQTNEPFEVTCLPNPGSTDFSLNVKCPDERKARLAIYDANGVRVAFRDVQLQEGKQHFIIHEAAALPAGVYIWKVISRSAKVQGHWIKI